VVVASWSSRLFSMGIPFGEKVARTIAVYLVLLVLLRLARRTAAQLSSFDLVVLLLLSNVVQNAIIGPDDSLVGGLIGAVVLIGANEVLVRGVMSRRRLDRALEGTEKPLVENGGYVEPALRRYGIRIADLEANLRQQGVEHVGQVERADLFPSGAIVVALRPDAHSASTRDVERLEERLGRIQASLDRLAAARP
jgi:uncharacterized membrane protein YcaP (DUF421 family)